MSLTNIFKKDRQDEAKRKKNFGYNTYRYYFKIIQKTLSELPFQNLSNRTHRS